MTPPDELRAPAANLRGAQSWTQVAQLIDALEYRADAIERLLADYDRWKSETITVLSEWDAVWLAAGKPGRLGQSKAKAMRELFPQ
jgi:hypothetical protein